MLLVCSLSFFFASESLFLGSVLKEGKKFNKVFFLHLCLSYSSLSVMILLL